MWVPTFSFTQQALINLWYKGAWSRSSSTSVCFYESIPPASSQMNELAWSRAASAYFRNYKPSTRRDSSDTKSCVSEIACEPTSHSNVRETAEDITKLSV